MGSPSVGDVEFRVLGTLEVVDGGLASAPRGVKERAVLARLLLEPGQSVSADALLDAAWPERSARDAGPSLQVRLTHLRSFLEPGRDRGAPSSLLIRDGGGYRLAVDGEQVDAQRFEQLVRKAQTLPPAAAREAYEEALGLWRGPPFAEVAYADFAQAEIRRLEDLRDRADEGRARALVELGLHEEALPDLERLVAGEPLREALVRSLALALYRAGRQVDALGKLRELGTGLAELGLEPGEETRELERRVLVHDPALAPGSAAVTVHRPLPAPAASRFFGRDRQLARATDLLRDRRLVTVTGVGGAGKTRFALELAGRLEDDFPDGRWWCELAPVESPESVAATVAAALGLQSSSDSGALERITDHLAPRRSLLVLDNCEHVLDGAARVAKDLLSGCPNLRVMVTSRTPLEVEGEHLLRLDGLEPEHDGPAVAMFVDRARAAGAVVDPASDAAAVPDLCRRLDGLPLAIELVAARTRSATLAEIVERLDVLDLGGRRVEPRHSTLRATIDWSYSLLDGRQRLLFERLSVFAQRAALTSIEEVCAGDGLDVATVPELLDQLVAQSMVTATRANERTRYGLLETMREYAAGRLEERGEQAGVRDRHVDHYAGRARRIGTLTGPPELPFLDELDEVRVALRRCAEADPGPERAFSILAPLWATAPARSAGEIALLAEESLQRWPNDHPLRMAVLETAATARLFFGDPASARRHAEAALALEESSKATAIMARRAIAHLAMLSSARSEALAITQDAAERARANGEEWLACECDGFTVQLLQATGDHQGAAELASGMRQSADRIGIPFMTCWAFYVSGIAELERDRGEARRWLAAAIELGVEAGHRHMVRYSLRALGVVALRDGDQQEAARRLLASLAHDEAQSDAASQWTTLGAIAALLAERGQTELAGRLLAAAEEWPAAPYLVELAARTSEKAAAAAPPADLGLTEAKALARAELADLT